MNEPRKPRTNFQQIVSFIHKGVTYNEFNKERPYFVVKDCEVVSCHENYNDAAIIAPYNGSLNAGKENGPAMTTSVAGLRNQGIKNPIP